MALPEPFLIRQKARATDNPDGVSHAKLEAKLMDPERLIIAHALSAAAKPYENEASLLPHNTSSLLKNPRHGESVVIQFSVTNRRRLACGAHL